MAKDKNKSRSFNLDKGGKSSFDLEKKSTRPFDLEKGDEESSGPEKPQPPSQSSVETSGGGGNGGRRKSKNWLLILLGVIVLAILAYLFIPQGHGVQEKSNSDSTEIVKDDSMQNKPNACEPSASSTGEQSVSSSTPSSGVSTDESSQSQSSASSDQTSSPQQTERVTSVDTAIEHPAENVDDQAWQVIKGIYGNNPERRHKLGAEYKKIQNRVNELMR